MLSADFSEVLGKLPYLSPEVIITDGAKRAELFAIVAQAIQEIPEIIKKLNAFEKRRTRIETVGPTTELLMLLTSLPQAILGFRQFQERLASVPEIAPEIQKAVLQALTPLAYSIGQLSEVIDEVNGMLMHGKANVVKQPDRQPVIFKEKKAKKKEGSCAFAPHVHHY